MIYRSICSLLTVCVLYLVGCGEHFFFEENHRLSADGWSYQDSVSFSFEIKDTSARYDLMLDLQHGLAFEYQNLYIRITTMFPDEDKVSQTLSIDLADTKGQWYGDCGGSTCKLRVVLQENAFFDQLGIHQIELAQHMRVDPIQHLDAISFLLRRN